MQCGRNYSILLPYLLDWREESYQTDFPKYLEYLRKSVEIICKNYGKIGGIWFDGMWDKADEDWEEEALYGTIRKYQPEAMIINNTGLNTKMDFQKKKSVLCVTMNVFIGGICRICFVIKVV